jgi:hypothetical protein
MTQRYCDECYLVENYYGEYEYVPCHWCAWQLLKMVRVHEELQMEEDYLESEPENLPPYGAVFNKP